MTGYTRNDTANNIADGNIINASDLDGEFDAIQSAFDATTGHTHDGTSGGGAPIEVVGPTQDVVVTGTVVRPKTDNTLDLGTSTLEFKDLYLDGTAKIDTLTVDENATVAGTLGVTGNTTASNITASGTVTYGSLSDGTITITAFVDEDNMVSNSATLVPTQQSVKAYVDAQVTAQDLDFQADTGGALNIDLDSEVLTIAGGTGISTSGLGNTVTIDIDSTVATLTGTQTLTNKTLTSPDINGGTVDGATIATSDITVGTGKTLNVSAGTLTLADNQISGDKVEGGTINATTINTLTSTTVNTTTVDTTNVEVTNIKAKDGTASATIADATGVMTVASSVLTTTDINGGTIDGTVIGGTTPAAVTGTTITGTSFVTTGDMTFGDNDKAIFGAGSDLQIYHDGTNSRIYDVGTGDLRLQGTNLRLQSANGENFLLAVEDGAVSLYYDNAVKLATTSTGVDVTGTVLSSDSVQIDSGGTGFFVGGGTTGTTAIGKLYNSAGVLTLDTDSTRSIKLATGTTQRLRVDGSTGDISFYEDTGTTAKMVWDASADALTFGDNDKAIFGAGSDLQIYHSGSESVILDNGTGNLDIRADSLSLLNAAGSEYYARFYTNGAANLYHDGNLKLNTTSTGVDVTGTITSDGLTVDGNAVINVSDPKLFFQTGATHYNWKIAAQDSTNAAFEVSSGNIDADATNDTYAKRLLIEQSGDISFYEDTGTTPKFFWDASAEVLTVDNRIKAGTTTDGVSIGSGSGTGEVLGVDTAGNGWNPLDIRAGSSTQLYLATSGNVGIGTSSPAYTLDISGGPHVYYDAGNSLGIFSASAGNDVSILARASQNLRLSAGGSERMRIDSSGNVGVATTSPRTKLDIEGNMALDGGSATTSSTTQTAIDTYSASTFKGCKAVITCNDGTDTYVTELLIANTASAAVATEYGQVGTGSALATFDVDVSGGNVRILATAASTTSTTYKVAKTLM